MLQKRNNATYWILISGIVFLEYLLFRSYVLREVVNYYPAFDDQAFYLQQSYLVYEDTLKNGLLATFIKNLHDVPSPSAFFFPIQAAWFYLFFGASRLSALTINFIYFAGLQFFIAKVIKDITKNNYLALIFIGLILASLTPFLNPGGLIDFRADFIICCLYGILVTCIIKAEVFLNRKWTLIAAAIMVLLIFLRFLTAIYVGTLILVLFGYFLFCFKYNKEKHRLFVTRTRLLNLSIFAGSYTFILMLLGGLMGKSLYHYYFSFHLGVTKIVKKAEEINNFIQTILYYPRSIIVSHVGLVAAIISILILLVLIFQYFYKKCHQKQPKQVLVWHKEGTFFLWISFLIPLGILSLDPSKSPIVAGIVLVPICWLLIWGLILFFYSKYQRDTGKTLLPLLAIISLLFGTYNYCKQFATKGVHDVRITEMYQDIGNYLTKNAENKDKQTNFQLTADQVPYFLSAAPAIAVLNYERNGGLLTCNELFLNKEVPEFLRTLSNDKILNNLLKSEVFILTTSEYPEQTRYPIENSFRDFHKSIATFAANNFIRLGDYEFNNASFRIYVNPKPIISGGTVDGWVSSAGLVIDLPLNIHRTWSKIVLSGELGFHWNTDNLKVIVSGVTSQNKRFDIPAKLKILGNNYQITFAILALPTNISRITIKFSSYFIPSKQGFGNDTRHLVVHMPIINIYNK